MTGIARALMTQASFRRGSLGLEGRGEDGYPCMARVGLDQLRADEGRAPLRRRCKSRTPT